MELFPVKQKIHEGFNTLHIHPYQNLQGEILFIKIRLENGSGEKWIRPISRNAAGNWIKMQEPSFKGNKPIYNLGTIAKSSDKKIYIFEGEKCVDLASYMGITSTTSGGAGSANDADWSPISGWDVIIMADCDKAGRQYAIDLKLILEKQGSVVNEVDVDLLNLPEGGDIVDWFDQFQKVNGRPPVKVDFFALPLKSKSPERDKEASINKHEIPIFEDDNEALEWLAGLNPLQYDRVLPDAAAALGVKVKTLNQQVREWRESIFLKESPFPDIEPWGEAIQPQELLDQITLLIRQYIALEEYQAQIAGLWVAASWFVNQINCAPILLINAPEKACGKTQLLSLLAKLAPRPTQMVGTTPSVLFRLIEAFQPTIFIDEIETLLKTNEALRALLNAGHTRDSAHVWRMVRDGDNHEPKKFSVWGMKSFAGINSANLQDTITSRALVLNLRRKRSDEHVERLRLANSEIFDQFSRKLARFSVDYCSQVFYATPELPSELSDREQDNWEPLMQIATVAGGHWPLIARDASLKLADAMKDPMSVEGELILDLKSIFDSCSSPRISSDELVKLLCQDKEKSWATFNSGRQITPKQIVSILKPYGITSKTIRISGSQTAKGFEKVQFEDTFARYLK